MQRRHPSAARAARALRRFARGEDGTIAIEAMIILPVMFWAFLAMFSIFHTFHQYSVNQKAAYTIGDAISRETVPIDDAYLNGTHSLLAYLTAPSGGTSLRVSSLWFDAASNKFFTDWSQTRGGPQPLTDAMVANWHSVLPVMPDKERVIVVETWNIYDPPFKTGLEQREIHNRVFTRPRYAPQVLWNPGSGA